MYGIIYCLTNKFNGMQYFGQTTRKDIERYWKSKEKGNSYINRAIRKYGLDNFDKNIFCECGDALSLGLMEDFCIQVFNTLAPNGYNLRRGGVHGKWSEKAKKQIIWTKERREELSKKMSKLWTQEKRKEQSKKSSKIWTKERREEQSEKHKGKKISEETKQKMTKIWTLEKRKQSSENWTSEKRKQLSEKLKGKLKSENHKNNMKDGWKKKYETFIQEYIICKYCFNKFAKGTGMTNHLKVCKWKKAKENRLRNLN